MGKRRKHTATLDMNSIPRALIVYERIVETSDERIVPKNYGAFMNSTDVMLSHYNNSHFYNGNRFVSMRIGLPIKEVPTVSIMLSMRYTYHDGPAIPEGLVGGVRPAICVSLSALQENK